MSNLKNPNKPLVLDKVPEKKKKAEPEIADGSKSIGRESKAS
jgi:hypothetical protein